MRGFVSDTVVRLRDRKFSQLPNVTARNAAVAKLADVSVSQVERIVTGKVGVSIDILESLAIALDVRPQDLVTPYFVQNLLDPERPSAQVRELRPGRRT